MSFAHVRQALNLKNVKGPARAVLIALADYANESGTTWPSIATLADDSGFSRTTVKDALRTLRRMGLVTSEARTDEEGDPTSNRYVLHLGGVGRGTPHPSQDAPHPGQDTPHGRAGDARQVGREPPPILSIEPTIEPTGGHVGNPLKRTHRRGFNPEASPEGIQFAHWFKATLPASMNLTGNWQESFAKAHDDLVRLDKKSPEQIRNVCQWARTDSFWQTNFMSPAKLRKRNGDGVTYFDSFSEKMKPTAVLKSKFAGIQESLQLPT